MQAITTSRRHSHMVEAIKLDIMQGTEPMDKPSPHSTMDLLKTFSEMWYHIFIWSLYSSVFVHTCAAFIAFVTLRKHKFGRFFSILILVFGVVSPVTSGIVSSAAIAFVHSASNLHMTRVYALIWGIGQTVLSACIGYTRILATL